MMNVIERAMAHGEHIEALTRYAGGYDAVPQPTTEVAQAIVRGYYELVAKNAKLRAQVEAARLDALGPSWSEMTDEQREHYPCLPQAELDALWNETPDATRGGAAA